MTGRNGRKNRACRNAASTRKYGRNPRKIWNEYPAVKARLVYLCGALFSGNSHEFAAAAGLCYRHLYMVLYGHSRLSVNMAAQIVSKTGVRAEWLLCGVGNMLAGAESDGDCLNLPAKISSAFPVFDALNNNPGIDFFPAERVSFSDNPVQNTKPYEAAARVVYLAHANQKSVGFFLGNDPFAFSVAPLVTPFFAQQYADFLVLTLTSLAHDIQATNPAVPVDLNSVARFAASRGMGYGEAAGLVGLDPKSDRQKSVLASVLDLGLPALVSAEIGELGRHTAPNVRGAEIGAAIGAAAYVDLFIYTEQLRNFFGDPGGVMIAAGDCLRAVHMFLARLDTLKFVAPQQTGFTFVLFCKPDVNLRTEIQLRGGHVIFLGHPTITALSQLFQTCNDVYAGKLTYD